MDLPRAENPGATPRSTPLAAALPAPFSPPIAPPIAPPAPLVVGRLPFLVCAPFFHSTLSGSPAQAASSDIRFVDGVPSFLNGELAAGRIDCAPSSSFEYGLHASDYLLFPGISTSSTMEMKSVLFLSQVPWEGLDGAPVALSSDSATSNVLFRILCARRFSVRPRLLAGDLAPTEAEAQAASGRVFIGDRALRESLSGRWAYRYDLADVWSRWQDLPFSFGLWMIRRDAQAVKAVAAERFRKTLTESVAAFKADPARALDAWTAAYPNTLPRDLMLGFYATADYGFGDRHARSLALYYRLACDEGYLPSVPELAFAP
jgi:chorismate dehydratase